MRARTASPPSPDPLLLDVQETSQALGVGRRTVWKLRDRGDLKSVKIGARVLFPRIEVDAYIRRLMDES